MTEYFLILAFIFAFLIPELIEIINLRSVTAANLMEDKIEKMKFFMVLGYTGYFILGYYLNKYSITKRKELLIYIFGFIGVIFTILSTSLLSNFKGEADALFYNNITINVAAISISVFVFFKNHIKLKQNSPQKKKILDILSRCSLGVYLIHIIVLDSLDLIFGINTLSFNPIISIPIISLLTIFISYLISIFLYKIPIIGKKIV